MITKDQMVEAIRNLPDDATIRDAIERLEFLASIDQGIAAADAGDIIPQDEVEHRVAEWLA